MDSRIDPGPPPAPPAACEREGERVRQLFAAYQTFVGHDLANRIVSIQGFSRQLEEGDVSSEEESKMLLGRIAALSNDVGLRARRLYEIGELLREPPWGPPVDLREVAEEVVVGIRCKADVRRIEFRLPEAARVPLAEPLLRRVLLELVANGVAAIGAGRAGRIEIAGQWSVAGGTLLVRDDGVGIPPERMGGLLRPTNAGGLLVGHQAAALWGGRLHIESAVGRGTTITLTTGGRE
jgi:signal transduction histidine kinase